MRSSDESVTLISAGKVQRTPVYSERAELLGEIYEVIARTVLTFGDILGMGKKYVSLIAKSFDPARMQIGQGRSAWTTSGHDKNSAAASIGDRLPD